MSPDSPNVPDSLAVETRYYEDDILSEGLESFHPQTRPNRYHVVFRDDDEARAAVADASLDGDFILETEFARSAVLVVQYGTQSARTLELQSIERIDAGLRVSVLATQPRGSFPDDAIVHSLAVRITDERDRHGDDILVSISEE